MHITLTVFFFYNRLHFHSSLLLLLLPCELGDVVLLQHVIMIYLILLKSFFFKYLLLNLNSQFYNLDFFVHTLTFTTNKKKNTTKIMINFKSHKEEYSSLALKHVCHRQNCTSCQFLKSIRAISYCPS